MVSLHSRKTVETEYGEVEIDIAEVKKNSIQFNVVAKDSTGFLIGKGKHFRAIVDIEKFMKTASEKGDIGSL